MDGGVLKIHHHDEDLCKVGQVDEGVLQVIRLKTELFHGKSEERILGWVETFHLTHLTIPSL